MQTKFCINKHKPLFFLLLSFSSSIIWAQQNRFLYLQTENKQPFYVKIEKQLFSSSAAGYLIIPKLADGAYTLTLGFPKNEWAEQNLQVTINKKDAGYLVKNFGEKGWGFFNWQTMDVVNAADKSKEPAVAQTAVKANEVIAVNKQEEKIPLPILKQTAPVEPEKKLTGIVKFLSVWTLEGIEMLYIDYTNAKPDTIRILIPEEKSVAIVPEQQKAIPDQEKVIIENKVPEVNTPDAEKPAEKVNEKEKTPPVLPQQQATVPVVIKETEKETAVAKPMLPNSDCKIFADDDDFLKLRKKMAAENNDDDMVAVARKVFKSKCFTAGQIKNLCVLFLSDQGKYKFFDAAYPFVSDSYNFKNLQTQLTDNYFINRFKSMLRQ